MNQSQGSTGNVIAALCSLFIPGLGQLLQGRVAWALIWFVLACFVGAVTFILTLGLLAHFGWVLVSIAACVHAAVFRRA